MVNFIFSIHSETRLVGFFLLQHLPWLASQVYTLKHDIINVQCLMPGLLLAIRKVVRLKVPQHTTIYTSSIFLNNLIHPVLKMSDCFLSLLLCQSLVYGLEKFLWSFNPLAQSLLFIRQSDHLSLFTKRKVRSSSQREIWKKIFVFHFPLCTWKT